MHGNKKVYGYTNVSFHASRPEGTEVWFATRAERDAALSAKRSAAQWHGLSPRAALGGIYPVTERLADLRREYDGHHVRIGNSDLECEVQR